MVKKCYLPFESGGPDKVINAFFIHGVQAYISYLTKLFNKIFNLRYLPEKLADGYIVPVHKKGSINDVQNYRGITLLSCFGKLFSRVINNRRKEWAETYHVYIEAQAGFRNIWELLIIYLYYMGLLNIL